MRIHLFCAAGMSTSLLVSKMQAAKNGEDIEIAAYAINELDAKLDGVDVALLGPQVGYQLKQAKAICEPKGIPVAVIPMIDYGLCNGANVLAFAKQLCK